ncbi:HAD-IA family hydrolase [Flagellatimonas centrodinii]|uniref:HAD-IA family hydrolase n=1 Tax=Flagellatimonas centrodinii TaxID=2806210 RepID=UPI001FF00FE2|nr:HAD-IA family hydrolase [Flagellatimonas centrodinii]ULQ45902.1 HAD-IA family hydrolase [Flagellatimonas centrodinii]
MTLKAILFDVDGTLADTESLGHRPAYNRAFRQMGLGFRWGPKLYRKLLRQPGGRERLRHYILKYQPDLGTHRAAVDADLDQWVAEVHALKSKYFRRFMRRGQVPLRPGIARLMREAHDAGVRLAIVTNASRKTLNPVLKFIMGPALCSVIEVVASGEEVGHKKPAPDLYRLAMARLGLTAADCVALEDSEMGLRAARAAGLPAVVTVNDDTREQDFSGAALVVSSLGEPGAPSCVLRGAGGPLPWVTLDTLRHLPVPVTA